MTETILTIKLINQQNNWTKNKNYLENEKDLTTKTQLHLQMR